eukprot:Protomagalhaensia_wolfi_Nauph_80__6091@NODE_863_length_1933_cov_45_667899_g650_i0_p2_GENE_NODE_863_length_1933_cov_45_667899_g650_i0NODE_863_length_1933_cov_45_667899_g650_i0_p2_ORF_typecomplete_len166_score27_75cwf21/PF08312_12/2_9e08cwf21/PF08312_12/8_7e02cwf21/PF08312_12/4_1e03_NODE_863_length_1933_cov_45_667899_g650_i012741771
MYNGIGLPTPRGSGTSGYIQRNLGHMPAGGNRRRLGKPSGDKKETGSLKVKAGGDPELLEHERRRKVEIQLLDYIDDLETKGIAGTQLDEMVEAKREELLRQEEEPEERDDRVAIHREKKRDLERDTHIRAKEKIKEEERMRRALKLEKPTGKNLKDFRDSRTRW